MTGRRSKHINVEDLKINLKPIEGSSTDFIGEDGFVYKTYDECLSYYRKSNYINKHNGYVYCGVSYDGEGNKSRRVHVLIAKAFMTNPSNLPIVGHKDNIKHNNDIDNLYWTTVKENTQKAFDDGLAVNAKGIEDSQSQPIACYTNDHIFVSVYGSIKEAGRCIKGFPDCSIHKVCGDKPRKGRKGYYFLTISKADYKNSSIKGLKFEVKYINKLRTDVICVNKITKEKYITTSQKSASALTGVSQSIISAKLRSGKVSQDDIWIFTRSLTTTENRS